MTSTNAAKPASDAPKQGRWRFSLGRLVQSNNGLRLGNVFAVSQFGPLAAARDVGIGLAIAVSLKAWISLRGWQASDWGRRK